MVDRRRSSVFFCGPAGLSRAVLSAFCRRRLVIGAAVILGGGRRGVRYGAAPVARRDAPRGGGATDRHALPRRRTSAAQPPPAAARRAAQGDPNPLKLPPRKVKLDPGRRVFTFSDPMLSGARLGSTLILYAANVTGFDGDDLIIEGRAGPFLQGPRGLRHPGAGRRQGEARRPGADRVERRDEARRGDQVRARTRSSVRYTDMDPQTAEGQLKNARFVRQVEGLVPGNYAALRDGDVRATCSWSRRRRGRVQALVLPSASAARRAIVGGGAPPAIPVKYSPKAGRRGAGRVGRHDAQGHGRSAPTTRPFTVKFERAGRPATVGWGLLMARPRGQGEEVAPSGRCPGLAGA